MSGSPKQANLDADGIGGSVHLDEKGKPNETGAISDDDQMMARLLEARQRAAELKRSRGL